VLPGLTDSEKDLDALARAAGEAGAQWFAANTLFLMPCSHKQFLPFIAEKFPKLTRQYREWYGRCGYAPETYQKTIAERVEALRRKYSIGGRPSIPGRADSRPQLTLAWKEQAPRAQVGQPAERIE
jgi:hypothetical protein